MYYYYYYRYSLLFYYFSDSQYSINRKVHARSLHILSISILSIHSQYPGIDIDNRPHPSSLEFYSRTAQGVRLLKRCLRGTRLRSADEAVCAKASPKEGAARGSAVKIVSGCK